MHVTIAALGSRGDVQPCVCLAIGFMHHAGWNVTIISHECHRAWIESLIASFLDFMGDVGADTIDVRSAGASKPAAVSFVSVPSYQIKHDGDRIFSTELTADEYIMLSTIRDNASAVVLFNLFALEAAHICEALRIPCVAVSPYVMPSNTPPPEFWEYITSTYPVLAQQLQDNADCVNERGKYVLGAAAVNHWMFSLFNVDRWSRLRAAIGLSQVFGCQKCTLTGEMRLNDDAEAIPLFYGFSPHLIEDPSWPRSVQAVGFWSVLELETAFSFAKTGEMSEKNDSGSFPEPCTLVTFGSMRKIASEAGVVIPCDDIAGAAAKVLMEKGMSCVYLVDSDVKLPEFTTFDIVHRCDSLSQMDELLLCTDRPVFCVLTGDIPLHLLLHRMQMIIHHGGSGTTAASLQAAVPQLVLPMMFDQPQWAKVVSEYGAGYALELVDDIEALATDLRCAITALTVQTKTASRCAMLGRMLAYDTGIKHVVSSTHTKTNSKTLPQQCMAEMNDGAAAASFGCKLHLPNATFVAAGSDEAIALYTEIFEDQVYAGPPEFFASLLRIVDEEHEISVIDVGANIGLFCLWIARLLHGVGTLRILAIEPSSLARSLFEQNRQVIKDADQLHLVDTLITAPDIVAANPVLPLVVYPKLLGNSTVKPVEKVSMRKALEHAGKGALFDDPEIEMVQTRTLSSVLTDRVPVHFMKIDVEGSELDALRGITSEHWKAILHVAVEVHNVNNRLTACIDVLRDPTGAAFPEAQILVRASKVEVTHSAASAPAADTLMVYAFR